MSLPTDPNETPQQWADRVISERGPMPDAVLDRIRRAIHSDPSSQKATTAPEDAV